jgi:hypothetical protein
MAASKSQNKGVAVAVLFHPAILQAIEEEQQRQSSTKYSAPLTLSRVVNRVMAHHFGLDLDCKKKGERRKTTCVEVANA